MPAAQLPGSAYDGFKRMRDYVRQSLEHLLCRADGQRTGAANGGLAKEDTW